MAECNSPAALPENKEAVDTETLACTRTSIQEGKRQSTQNVEEAIAENLHGWRLALLTIASIRIPLVIRTS